MKVLKTHNSSYANPMKLDNEFNFSKTFSHPSIRPSIERLVYENQQALLLEWAPGVPLSQIECSNIKHFLTLAREVVSSLLAMHTSQFMHMDLTCDHVIYNDQDHSTRIISCGSCTKFVNSTNYISKQELYQKDLRFISPEQIGLGIRCVDYRSDFYSLGVIFYKLLTGEYPFDCDNELNFIRLHIFEDPIPACVKNPSVPVILSDMISMLLAKDAEDRYQTTKGIVHDLDLMISEYDVDINLSSIKLAQHDIPEILMLPQKLYGRSDDYNTLRLAFDRVQNSFELVLVSGESGTGELDILSFCIINCSQM